jgi:hypothetical protein
LPDGSILLTSLTPRATLVDAALDDDLYCWVVAEVVPQ